MIFGSILCLKAGEFPTTTGLVLLKNSFFQPKLKISENTENILNVNDKSRLIVSNAF